MTETYAKDFYDDRRTRTLAAARRVLGTLRGSMDFRSVVDVGCGTGTWLSAAREQGAGITVGLEGDWMSQERMDEPELLLSNQDLEKSFSLDRWYDLAISLEVAEHLTPERAEHFVAELCRSAPVILFSAAIPGQGGVNHLNEQWQSYWARLFADHGYAAYDIVRPAVWTDETIPAWYRQNIIVYAAAPDLLPDSRPVGDLALLDRVHPWFWNRANRELKYAGALPESEYLKRQAVAAEETDQVPTP